MDKVTEIAGKIKASKALNATKRIFTSLTVTGLAGVGLVSCGATNTTTVRVIDRGDGRPTVIQSSTSHYDPSRSFRNNAEGVSRLLDSSGRFLKTLDSLGR